MTAETKMIQANRLRTVFTENKGPAMGFWQMLPGANISRALARAGADWVMVDCEHGAMDGRGLLTSPLGDGVEQLTIWQTAQCTRQCQQLRLSACPQL
jgi:hypothetical protein